jgi:hypothetical protein
MLTDGQLANHETQLEEWLREPGNHCARWALTFDHIKWLAVSLKEVRQEIAKRHVK